MSHKRSRETFSIFCSLWCSRALTSIWGKKGCPRPLLQLYMTATGLRSLKWPINNTCQNESLNSTVHGDTYVSLHKAEFSSGLFSTLCLTSFYCFLSVLCCTRNKYTLKKNKMYVTVFNWWAANSQTNMKEEQIKKSWKMDEVSIQKRRHPDYFRFTNYIHFRPPYSFNVFQELFHVFLMFIS